MEKDPNQLRQRVLASQFRIGLLAMLFVIHFGRTDFKWSTWGLQQLLFPFLALFADILLALLLYLTVVKGLSWLWQKFRRSGTGGSTHSTWFELLLNPSALLMTTALVAINSAWGFTWVFNPENWVTGIWDTRAYLQTDKWRISITKQVSDTLNDTDFDVVTPSLGLTGQDTFSFLVIGDPGEGDSSQEVLRDQYLSRSTDQKVKFVLISSDVIYPDGTMDEYERKFYLPFKGVNKPIFGLPGNHDWYNKAEGFIANFYTDDAQKAAIPGLCQTQWFVPCSFTTRRMKSSARDAWDLRDNYKVQSGQQRNVYFQMQTEKFALFVVDTGCRRRIDDDQYHWLEGALKKATGKFKMVVLGHPLYVHGAYQGQDGSEFKKLGDLLVAYQVDVVMAGDTHYFEYYRVDQSNSSSLKPMHHFVNGGGGAYLSLGTPFGMSSSPVTSAFAFYPKQDKLRAKLKKETPWWKQPFLQATLCCGTWHWPSGESVAESLSPVFNFNTAPFYQSFVEVSVDTQERIVSVIPYGSLGQLKWADLHVSPSLEERLSQPLGPVVFKIPMP